MAWGPFNAGGGGGSSGGTAADISYDNSKSGISAANVQEAIDALSVLTLTIQAVPAQSGSLTYTGSTQSPTWKGYDSSMMTIGGVTSGINAGTYTATFTPIGKYVWTDGTQEAKSVSWTIGRAEVGTGEHGNSDIIEGVLKRGLPQAQRTALCRDLAPGQAGDPALQQALDDTVRP